MSSSAIKYPKRLFSQTGGDASSVASTPTYNLQIGASGNNVLPFIGSMYDVVIQNNIDLPSVRNSFINALKAAEGIL